MWVFGIGALLFAAALAWPVYSEWHEVRPQGAKDWTMFGLLMAGLFSAIVCAAATFF